MKRIEGYSWYRVSETGEIWSGISKKYLKRSLTREGYLQVTLSKDHAYKTYTSLLIGRLVAQAYLPNPHNEPWVIHIDGNKLNNEVSNLRWSSKSEAHQHSYKTNNRKLSTKGIIATKGKETKTFESVKAAAEFFNYGSSYLIRMIKGRNKNTTGWKLKYKKPTKKKERNNER